MKRQRAQTLILVALMLTVLLGFLALALDGGNAYLQRRRMQNAADAGALAGAKALCSMPQQDWVAAAQDFCLRNNSGSDNLLSSDERCVASSDSSKSVTVTASTRFGAWFARVIGINDLNISATATGSCGPATGTDNLLPVVVMMPDSGFAMNHYYELFQKDTAGTYGAFGWIGWPYTSGNPSCTCGTAGAKDLACTIGQPQCAPFITSDNDMNAEPIQIDANNKYYGGDGWWNFPKPGVVNANDVWDEVQKLCCKNVLVPVYDQRQAGGAGTWYHIVGFAEFTLTATCQQGGGKVSVCGCGAPNAEPTPDYGSLCGLTKDATIFGYFTGAFLKGTGSSSGGNDYGTNVVYLTH